MFFQGAKMPARFVTYSLATIIAVLLIVMLFVTVWANPTAGLTLGLIFFLFVLAATSYTIVIKNREAYRLGKITLATSIRNICLEIAAIMLAMILAGLIGRFISGMALGGMTNNPVRLITGIGIGLLVGWTIGLLIKRTCGHLVKAPSGK